MAAESDPRERARPARPLTALPGRFDLPRPHPPPAPHPDASSRTPALHAPPPPGDPEPPHPRARAPTAPGEVGDRRGGARERRAGRREGWAGARERHAAALEAANAPYQGDWAFATQPGHIPERAGANRRTERAFEHSRAAREHRAKAEHLRARGARVKGDAEAAREARRERVREWARPGMWVWAPPFPEPMQLVRVSRKTATVKGAVENYRVELADLMPAPAPAPELEAEPK